LKAAAESLTFFIVLRGIIDEHIDKVPAHSAGRKWRGGCGTLARVGWLKYYSNLDFV
jgi:hypothetical protein